MILKLIFAIQAKKVFYIQEPSRVDQINNHGWVVENVNHRKVRDLPICKGRIKDVDNVSTKNVDVIHSNCSSNCRLVIDFQQYFENLQPTSEIEVSPPTGVINEVSEGDNDYDESDADYDTEMSEDDTEVSEGVND